MAIIIDKRYVDVAKKYWGDKHSIIPSFCCEKLQEPVSCHPDMTIVPVGEKLVCCPEGYEYYRKFLGDRVVCANTNLSFHYPSDIAYNVMIYKKFAFCKEEYTDEVVKEELKKQNIKIVNVNQGYAKCSSVVCREGIITADDSIFNACIDCCINVLKISHGHVMLKGYEYGFLGGASGMIDGVLSFFGDVSRHPDFDKIKSFSRCKYFEDFPLTDIGTIFCI